MSHIVILLQKIPENNEVSTGAISKDLPGPSSSCDVEETTHEATYISYKDGDSSSGISSEETNGGVRIKEELKEIQERCENLQQILHHEIEAKSSGQSVCIRKIRKLVEQTMYDTRDMMNYAKAYIRNDKCVVKCDKLYSEILEQILSVVNGAQANIQYSVIGLGISIEDSVRQLISGSEKKYGSVEIVHGMIEKLDKHHSEPKLDLLAAAQKKVNYCCTNIHFNTSDWVFFKIFNKTDMAFCVYLGFPTFEK